MSIFGDLFGTGCPIFFHPGSQAKISIKMEKFNQILSKFTHVL